MRHKLLVALVGDIHSRHDYAMCGDCLDRCIPFTMFAKPSRCFTAMHTRTGIERLLEAILFNSRWILAPVYLGLIVSLLMLLTAFVSELVEALPHLIGMSSEEVILVVLSLIDLSLALNLVLIVVFSGYENFVSKIDTGDSEDRPHWMGTLDFSGLKMS